MRKAIFYKEWIKLHRAGGLLMMMCICFTGYSLLRIQRVIEFKGIAHLWEILLQKEVVFIELLKYIPLVTGIVIGIVQFIPEMQQKRLKLTLHLPFSHQRMILLMLSFGLLMICTIFAVQSAILSGYLYHILAPELAGRIILTALPWFFGGIGAYIFTAWICLEPTRGMRIINLLIAAATLRIFFLTDTPQAYDSMLLPLILLMVCTIGFPWLSVKRFTAGKQD